MNHIYDKKDLDDDIKFILHDIIENEEDKYIYIFGEVGYIGDDKYIELMYKLDENRIYICSTYRLLHEPNECKKYENTYEMTLGKAYFYNKETDKIDKKDSKNMEMLKMDKDGIPYYRFPRTKDGITIPNVIHNIFKIYETNEPKPKIMIPTEWYYYNY